MVSQILITSPSVSNIQLLILPKPGNTVDVFNGLIKRTFESDRVDDEAIRALLHRLTSICHE